MPKVDKVDWQSLKQIYQIEAMKIQKEALKKATILDSDG